MNNTSPQQCIFCTGLATRAIETTQPSVTAACIYSTAETAVIMAIRARNIWPSAEGIELKI